jgi:hypothetical protein
MRQKTLSICFVSMFVLSIIAGCSPVAPGATQSTGTLAVTIAETGTVGTAIPVSGVLAFNNSAWQYDSANDVYWQLGIQYCAAPETLDFETLGIYVPGAYMDATDNGDGTYTAAINEQGSINGFTAETAPMVFPVNTPGYSAQQAPTAYNYNEIFSYISAGFIYIYAGMRGRDNGYDASGSLVYSGGAPWGVTDLKAAVRYVRYNKDVLPGNTDSIFVFGMSGGGAQSTVMGASGDSPLYTPYLESIGAAMVDASGESISDAISGVMAWCPITSLDYADEAYEWNMGQYAATETRADGIWTSALSKDLAAAYANYINNLGLTDGNGYVLALEGSVTGIYAAGSYYDYVLSTVQGSLNNFLADTTFPYTKSSGGFPGGGPAGGMHQGGMLPGGTPPSGTNPSGNSTSTGAASVTYQTVQEYINSLNADTQWVTYDPATNTARITSLAGFVNSQKNPSKSVAAFDDLDRSQAENNVFGNDAVDSLHFDAVLSEMLAANQATYAAYSDWDASYMDEYAADLTAIDKLGSTIQERVDMYNPMYYLLDYYAGYQTSTPALHWRINTGIDQGDTSTTVEMNLALALETYTGVKDVEFTTVWDQGHTMAERTGNSTDNFIAWVIQVVEK